MKGAWHSLASLAVALVAPPAAALAVPPLPQPPQLVAAVVPANGVVGVRLPDRELGESLKAGRFVVRVTDQSGAEVTGEVVTRLLYFTVFHPAQPLAVGATYTLQLADPQPPTAFVPKHAWTTPLQFSVTAAREPSIPSAAISPTYLDIGGISEGCCGGSCFVTAIREGVIASLTAQIEGDASTVGQYVYAFDWEKNNEPNTSRGWSTTPQINVPLATRDGPPFEPCRLFYAYSLADDTEHLLAGGCVEEDKVVPQSARLFPVDDKLTFDDCREPSVGLVERWCDVNFDQCYGDETACPGYLWRCSSLTTALRSKHAGPTEIIPAEQTGCSISAVRSRNASCLLSLLLAVGAWRVTTGSLGSRAKRVRLRVRRSKPA